MGSLLYSEGLGTWDGRNRDRHNLGGGTSSHSVTSEWLDGRGQVTPLGKDFWRRCTDVERCTGGSILGRSNKGRLCFLVCSFLPSFSSLSDILPIALRAASPFSCRFASSPREPTPTPNPKVQTLPWVIGVMKSPLATGIVIATLGGRTRLSFHAPVWRLPLPTPGAYMQGLALLLPSLPCLREDRKGKEILERKKAK